MEVVPFNEAKDAELYRVLRADTGPDKPAPVLAYLLTAVDNRLEVLVNQTVLATCPLGPPAELPVVPATPKVTVVRLKVPKVAVRSVAERRLLKSIVPPAARVVKLLMLPRSTSKLEAAPVPLVARKQRMRSLTPAVMVAALIELAVRARATREEAIYFFIWMIYKTPADIENIIKEAALIATRSGRDVIRLDDISEAIERVDMGMKHKRTMQPQEREMVAYHESGHLIVLYILHPIDDVFKASIASRRDTLGVVYHQPREEMFTKNKERLLADIKVALGGYVAEKIRFGTTSDGVSMDFRTAMIIAHNMVWRFGMGDAEYLGDYTAIPESQLSDKVKETLNEEVDKIFRACLKDVQVLLAKEKLLLERFVKELLEKEELDYDEIEAIFNEYGKSHIKAA